MRRSELTAPPCHSTSRPGSAHTAAATSDYLASQVVGFIEVFDIHAGSKAGFVPKLFASYNLNEGDLLAERRVPRRPSED